MSELPLSTVLQDDAIYLRRIMEADWKEAAALGRRSAAFMHHFGPPPPESAYSRKAFRDGVKGHTKAWETDIAYAFHIFRRADDVLLGFANLHHISGKASAMIGFAIGVDHARNGVAHRAGHILLGLAFDRLNIHRVTGFCTIANTPSAGLLKKLGLQEEGIARGMLKVGQEWKDARQFAILQEDWLSRPASARPLTPS